MLDFDAPIEPGKAAAGVALGDRMERLGEVGDSRRRGLHGLYEFTVVGPVCVWAKGGVIDQIGVRGGYTGRIEGTAVGIGATIQQVAEEIGPVVEDDEDNLIVADLLGLCFETERWRGVSGRETVGENLDARVTEIYVFQVDGLDQPTNPPHGPPFACR